jgi:hypothetical protein
MPTTKLIEGALAVAGFFGGTTATVRSYDPLMSSGGWFPDIYGYYGSYPTVRVGDYSDIKPAVVKVPGPLESGVLDRPEPSVSDMDASERPTFSDTAVDLPEFLPGSIYAEPREPTDWDEFYEQYKILNPETESEVAIDWGTVIGGALGDIAGGLIGPGAPPVAYNTTQGFLPTVTGGGPSGIPSGAKVQIDPKTGKVTLCRRRRRRRLLTPTDLNDLAALKTIVGGGQAINFAVMKAVRR